MFAVKSGFPRSQAWAILNAIRVLITIRQAASGTAVAELFEAVFTRYRDASARAWRRSATFRNATDDKNLKI